MGMKQRGTKLTRGIGTNDMDYDVFKRLPDGKVWHCPIYRAWANMLTRVTHKDNKYSYDYEENFGKSYFDVSVCNEWLLFSNFHRWYSSQDYEGKNLDKDLLGDGTIYSPETCCLIPHILNVSLTTRRVRVKGVVKGHLVGVSQHKNKFYYTVNFNSKKYAYGSCDTEIEAHQMWQKYKSQLLRELSKSLLDSGEISEQIHDAIMAKCDVLDSNRMNNIVTEKLL